MGFNSGFKGLNASLKVHTLSAGTKEITGKQFSASKL